MQQEVTQVREEWLERAASFLFEHMKEQGIPSVSVRVSCGWPVSGGAGTGKRVVIGQCFSPTICDDGRPQVFISPRIAESVEVLGVLLHELLHASLGTVHGHKRVFSQAAKKVGLAGPPTATVVSKELRPVLQAYVDAAGIYPHAAIHPVVKEKKGSRLRLYQCQCEEPIKVRVSSDKFQARCLVCGEMFVFIPKEED